MSNWNTLREKARDAILTGRLPSRPADRMWGGPGVGSECAICGAPIDRFEMEYELEFGRGDDDLDIEKYRAHIRCVAAWECERETLEPAARGSAAAADRPASTGSTGSERAATPGLNGGVNGYHADLPGGVIGGKLSGHGPGGNSKG